jgi:hypothetical protein
MAPLPITSAVLDGGKWQTSHPCYFNPRKEPPILNEEQAEWAKEMVWMILEKRKSLAPVKIQPTDSHYNNYAIPTLFQTRIN